MRGLSLILAFLIVIFSGTSSDSPHGDKLEISCDECHTSEGWDVDRNNITFNHDLTKFRLTGLHIEVDCKSCHESLIFSEAEPDCMSCHIDMHQQTVGLDCSRCHNTNSWIVSNITEIHQMSRFPLLGAHSTADCYDCHVSASLLKFEPIGVECVDCHQNDYNATTDPSHAQSGFSTDCAECHKMDAFSWSGSSFTHSFFPLTQGHSINDCSKCHQDSDYSNISPDCLSCHESDYLSTTSPSHQQADLSTNCVECHTTNPGWKPADFPQHDVVFPIYSGEHNGEWASCVDCHTNPNNYSLFTCIDCHEHNKNDMDDEHQGIGGYLYSSPACLECHPNGSEEGSFNHNSSSFPLTGAHITTECSDCHSNGYSNTPSECFDCHAPEFNTSINPNHNLLGLSNNCETCHTTQPGWEPASFDNHNDYYVLSGAHAPLLNDCFACHQGNYQNTPNTCFDCHENDYNQAVDPPHASAQFGTDCLDCHTEFAWEPSTFDHDNQYFRIYSGEHQGEWNTCNECHPNSANYAIFSCIDCHEHNKTDMDDEHKDELDYTYNSIACLDCHPDGSEKSITNHIQRKIR